MMMMMVVVMMMMMMMVVVTEVGVVRGEVVLGKRNEDFDFDGLPGVQHEFKVDIPGGVNDCFFQRVARGANVHVSFEVLRGGDYNVDVVVSDSQGQVVNYKQWKRQGVIEFQSPYEDTYAVCVDNRRGGFTARLVYLYLAVFLQDDWTAYVQDMADILDIAENVTVSLSRVEKQVQNMSLSQSSFRRHAMRDMYLVWANHSYVQTWSLLQCVVIVLTSLVQVVFLRRLFRPVNVTPSAKPRA
ncbi:transmembrane emp24 domain-containing protein 6-like [Babylonia areolata]|uniref:transmembrane emp24 domain-containing protein 6-like n=1 Tax=Babylonia areolata TaxID=304850 RepID=UPI003FD1C59A